MKFHFSSLHLPEIPQPQAKKLIKLAENNGKNSSLEPPKLPAGVPIKSTNYPRDINEIIFDLENGNTDKVTVLEWVYCLYAKEKWDSENSDRSEITSKAIWKAAQHNLWLKHRLFWGLALYCSANQRIVHNREILASSLAESLSVFVPHTDKDRQTLKIINILKQERSNYQIAKLCREKLLTPRQLFNSCQLPERITPVEEALEFVVQEFSMTHRHNKEQLEWLLCCLKEMSREQELKEVEYLLINVASEVASIFPNLVSWIHKNYGFGVVNSRWSELSSFAKNVLRKWIGAVNYGDFQKLVNVLLNRLYLEDWERNQLKKRKEFWANYSDRFERIRILLPKSSVQVLGADLSHQDIGILVEDGSQSTEVCIFDFRDWFVVEFFRGLGSETRIFKSNPDLENKLFNSSELSIKRLRCLGGDVHDHLFCWQYYCEQWLRNKNICPNEGTKYFKGLSYEHSRYDCYTGLPQPSLEDRRKRQYKVKRWQQELDNLSHLNFL
jgi:EH_Signature domain